MFQEHFFKNLNSNIGSRPPSLTGPTSPPLPKLRLGFASLTMSTALVNPYAYRGYIKAFRTFRKYSPYFRTALRAYRAAKPTVSSFLRSRMKRKRSMPMKRTYNKRARVAGVRQRVARIQTQYTSGGLPDATPSDNIIIGRKQLWTAPIKFARIDNTNRRLGEVQGTKIYVKGIKCCLYGVNESSNDLRDYIVHFALIQPKQVGTDATPISSNFFVNPGGGAAGQDKYLNFVDVSTTSAWDPRYNCNGINPDRFNIITHKKYKLANNTPGSHAHSMYKEGYYKINKTFEYALDNATTVSRPIYAVLWYERIFGDVSTGLETSCKFSLTTNCYFKSIN